MVSRKLFSFAKLRGDNTASCRNPNRSDPIRIHAEQNYYWTRFYLKNLSVNAKLASGYSWQKAGIPHNDFCSSCNNKEADNIFSVFCTALDSLRSRILEHPEFSNKTCLAKGNLIKVNTRHNTLGMVRRYQPYATITWQHFAYKNEYVFVCFRFS